MQEIKLWEITTDDSGKPAIKPVKGANQVETESQLEEILVHAPNLLMEELKLIGRQTETSGGPLDLLGVDGEGRIVVFELKRGSLTRESVAQIIDYTSYLSGLEVEELSSHISERSGHMGIDKIDNFSIWYQEQFGRGLSSSQRPRMVLVGLGTDDRTSRMVSFLANSDLDISLITFHGFEKNGKIFLAKQVEVKSKEPPKVTKKENLEKLQERVKALLVEGFYFKMAAFFRENLSAYEWPNPGGYSYYLPELTEGGSESNRVYVSLYLHDNRPSEVHLVFHGRAVQAALGQFKAINEKMKKPLKMKAEGSATMWINSQMEWNELTPHFSELCAGIVEGWKKKREEEVSQEFEETGTERDAEGEEGNHSKEGEIKISQ